MQTSVGRRRCFLTAILGISAFYHDSAAALVVDGRIVAAAQEERFTRKKHDPGFPTRAVQYCLQEAGLNAADLDYIAFYDKPLTKFERLLETYLAFAPAGLRSFSQALPVWLKEKLFTRRTLRAGVGGRAPLVFLEHHESHAASAFFPSPFAAAAGVAPGPAAHGPGRQHSGGDGRSVAADGGDHPPPNGPEKPRPGRRRGAQLRGQRPPAARGTV